MRYLLTGPVLFVVAVVVGFVLGLLDEFAGKRRCPLAPGPDALGFDPYALPPAPASVAWAESVLRPIERTNRWRAAEDAAGLKRIPPRGGDAR